MDLLFILLGILTAVILPLTFTVFLINYKVPKQSNLSSYVSSKNIEIKIRWPLYLMGMLLMLFGYFSINKVAPNLSFLLYPNLFLLTVSMILTGYSLKSNGKMFHTYISRFMVFFAYSLFFILSYHVKFSSVFYSTLLTSILVLMGILISIVLVGDRLKVTYLPQLILVYGFGLWILLFTLVA